MSQSPVKRTVRVAERIRLELTEVFIRGEIRDPQAAGVMLSRVVVTDDLRIARIYVRLMETEVKPIRQKSVVRALERASGFLRRKLSGRLEIKHTPELQFRWDDGIDHQNRVEAILEELKHEERAGDDGQD